MKEVRKMRLEKKKLEDYAELISLFSKIPSN